MTRRFWLAMCASGLVVTAFVVGASAIYALDPAALEPSGSLGQVDGATIVYGEPIENGVIVSGSEVLERPYRVAWHGEKILVNGRTVAVLSVGGEKRPASLEAASKDFVATLERGLYSGGAFLAFDQSTWVFLEMQEEAGLLLQAILKANGVAERVQAALGYCANDYYGGMSSPRALSPNIPTSQWRTALERFEDNDSLREFFDATAVYDEMAADTVTNAPVIGDSTHWMYALNLTGMLLAVVSCGVLIGHRPESGFRWGKIIETTSAERLMQYSILLIIGLSIFDLIATLFANSTGGFVELNPVAGSLMKSALGLAAFKLILTGMSVGILWYRREYAFAQQAAWWVCLLLTLVTMRWVTIQSLFYV